MLIEVVGVACLVVSVVGGEGHDRDFQCVTLNSESESCKPPPDPREVLRWVVLASLVTCSASVGCALALFSKDNHGTEGPLRMSFLLAFASGGMLGDVFLHILPHLSGESPEEVAQGVLFGIFVFFVLDLIISMGDHSQSGHSIASVGVLNLVSDALHNFTDGVMVAVSFNSSYALGRSTTLAVLLHELPQEMGDFSVLLRSGLPWSKALLLNFCCSLFAVLGAVLSLLAKSSVAGVWSVQALSTTAGGLVYTATVGVISELKNVDKEHHSGSLVGRATSKMVQIAGFSLGVAAMAVLLRLEGHSDASAHGHGHGHGHGHAHTHGVAHD